MNPLPVTVRVTPVAPAEWLDVPTLVRVAKLPRSMM
jgi:hypothetical protein